MFGLRTNGTPTYVSGVYLLSQGTITDSSVLTKVLYYCASGSAHPLLADGMHLAYSAPALSVARLETARIGPTRIRRRFSALTSLW